ncbi:MAG: TlpA family protein disulfide reductase [Bacteroidales bacterium]|nr:TlpA family protein disulfide reductase [Bacteroidales bacterium]
MLKMILKLLSLFLLIHIASHSLNAQTGSSPKTGIEIGNLAPDITLKDMYENDLSLYNLRGNIVFISFWAAWCRPCRHENLQIVEIFQTFKDVKFSKGERFRIFSVSLDKTRENWINAINKDGLVWSDHVSSLEGWESPVAKTYDIRAIPANLLLDSNGIIIAKNLKIEQLNELLQKFAE